VPTVNVYLNEEIFAKLAYLAEARKRKMTSLIQDAVREYLVGKQK